MQRQGFLWNLATYFWCCCSNVPESKIIALGDLEYYRHWNATVRGLLSPHQLWCCFIHIANSRFISLFPFPSVSVFLFLDFPDFLYITSLCFILCAILSTCYKILSHNNPFAPKTHFLFLLVFFYLEPLHSFSLFMPLVPHLNLIWLTHVINLLLIFC